MVPTDEELFILQCGIHSKGRYRSEVVMKIER